MRTVRLSVFHSPSTFASMSTASAPSLNRPCDRCRNGKRRCDGPMMSDNVCTRCARAARKCLYSEASSREVTVPKGYIEALEARVTKVQNLLSRIAPQTHLMRELGLLTIRAMPSVRPNSVSVEDEQESDVGRSIAATLCPLQELYIQRVGYSNALHRLYASDDSSNQTSSSQLPLLTRPEYWRIPDHEFQHERLPDRAFYPQLPTPDRLALLVRRYFETYNVIYPLFHRELFERQLLHQTLMLDAHFVAIVLLVCALGEGQLTADGLLNSNGAPYISIPSRTERLAAEPAGLKYFTQVEPFLRMPTPAEPRLLDVQIFYLAALYTGVVLGSTAFWSHLDTAIKLAIQRDDHRCHHTASPNLVKELNMRTFWSLVVLDRRAASIFGRPTCIKDDAFDLDLPLEVEDSRWDFSTFGFPLISPSKGYSCSSSFFPWQVRLSLIQGFILGTIYSTTRTRTLLGFVGSDWEQSMMQRLEGLLKDWVTNVPEALNWDPNIADMEVFLRVSFLHAMYHNLVIMAYNPFVRTTAREFSRASREGTSGVDLLAALAICTQAALECSDILALVIERVPWAFGLPGWGDPTFISGLVLLVNLHGFRSNLDEVKRLRFMRAVNICVTALKLCSTRCRMNGTLW
ncbi:fungal-specific transcription factor domain-containing protein, partial [Auriculariales sp. MPI-PUGE-AT-0066]